MQALPYPGGMAEQPAYVFEALQTCELEAQKHEAKQARQAQQELDQWRTRAEPK